jgi:NADPH2:quinone reductase
LAHKKIIIMYALTFDSFGGPEVLSYRELPEPELPAGHIKLAMRAIGLNFADIYRRRGAYHLVGQPPYIAGYEGAGVVLALGADVNGIACGERYAFADVPLANASRVIVPFDHAIPLPDDITEVAAAAILLQGLTAQYLVEDSYCVQEHDWVLVHAAAGGVGQLLTQFATARGAQVIAMASSPAKRQIALQRGAVHAWATMPTGQSKYVS